MNNVNTVKSLGHSRLSRIQRGKQQQAIRLVCMGIEGVGKSTFAAGAPSPIFLTTEPGTAHLDIARLPQPQSWEDVAASLAELQSDPHEFKTLVVDSVTGLEPLLQAKVCEDNNWKDLEQPGFGKGHVAALEHWRRFVKEMEVLWSVRGMNIVLIAHTTVRAFRNPDGDDFERYQMALNDKASGLLRQWADAVTFARHEAFTKVDPKTKRAKGFSTGARIMHTTWASAYDAKNRYGLPEELPLSWQAFEDAVNAAGPQRATELRAQIEAMLAQLTDATVISKARGYMEQAKDSATALAEVANAVAVKLEESKKGE